MKNQEKDLQNAREYLDNVIPNGIEKQITPESLKALVMQLVSEYPKFLEQKGVIKFTENRDNDASDNGLIKCKQCDSLNCKNNNSCIECGEPDYK